MNRFLQKQLSRSIDTNSKLWAAMNIKWYKKPEIIIPTILSIILTVVVMYQTYELSLKNQSVEGFDTLLRYSQAQIDTLNSNQKVLTEQLAVLNEQLGLNRETQKKANKLSEYSEEADHTRFYTAIIKMSTVIEALHPPGINGHWNENEVITFIKEIKPLLESQLDNSYLIKNKEAFDAWNKAWRHIQLYENVMQQGESFSDRIGYIADKINGEPIEKDMSSCWKTVKDAFSLAADYITGQ